MCDSMSISSLSIVQSMVLVMFLGAFFFPFLPVVTRGGVCINRCVCGAKARRGGVSLTSDDRFLLTLVDGNSLCDDLCCTRNQFWFLGLAAMA